MDIQPNAFIIGVQKGGTTTLNYWLTQHPEIFASENLKDVAFLLNEKREAEMIGILEQEYKATHNGNNVVEEPVILLSCVEYCYYPQATEKIAKFFPQSKLIMVLRNPVDRALSAYRFAYKIASDARNITDAFNYDYSLNESKFVWSQTNNHLLYIEYGLYSFQIENILKRFPRKDLHIVDFADLENDPKNVLKEIYDFLGLKEEFYPDFKLKNVTGKVRFRFLNKMVVSKHPAKKWLVKTFIKPWLSFSKRRSFVNKVREVNTSSAALDKGTQEEKAVVKKLQEIYRKDVKKLDELLNTSFAKTWNLN